MKVIEGAPRAFSGQKFAICASRFNDSVVERLVEGANRAFLEAGAAADDIYLIWVPGALEISWALDRLISAVPIAACVGVGLVQRGETAHFDVVVRESASALARLQERTAVPVANGILTVDNRDQAIERAGGKFGNKGYDAAVAALRLATLAAMIAKEA
jgi:6,7-dimethyl-8-ribityllumazine synthase